MTQATLARCTPRARRSGRPSRMPGPRAARARGMILVVVLAVMAITMLASLGALRSADSANVMAGNFSFQQAAAQASDRAVGDAMNTVSTVIVGGAGNTAVANLYMPVQASKANLDAMGVPTAINWANVACRDEKGTAVADCATDAGNYRVQYVVERLCRANPTFTDMNSIRNFCEYETSTTAAAVDAQSISLRYRVLIRVRGPRGTDRFFEAVVAGPAST